MRRWTFVLPFVYLLFLFALAFMDFPRYINRQWMWIQIGGLLFMIVLGAYLDRNIPTAELTVIGAFTLLWLALAFLVTIREDYFVLLGLIIELVIVVLIERFFVVH